MRRLACAALVLASLAGGCGKEDGKTADNGPELIEGFTLPPLADGYTRIVTPPIRGIKPGEDITYCQYIVAPAEKTLDILDITGGQSKWGHHAVLYATTAGSVGLVRECLTADQLSLNFMGGVGGEGTEEIFKNLPPNTGFQLPKGYLIMANLHFVNTSDHEIDGQAYLDIKYADPTPERKPLGMFVNIRSDFKLPAGQESSVETTCVMQADMDLVLSGNHMHEWGKSIFTELIDGTTHEAFTMRRDDVWKKEFVFAPEFMNWSKRPEGLLHVKKGDSIHTKCTWENSETRVLQFPSEMCVGINFFLATTDPSITGQQVVCESGEWGLR